jgi:hypothetical protein
MAAAGKKLVQMGVGRGILTKTKVTNNQCSKFLLGYRVIMSTAVSPHQGGVCLIWREDHDGFEVEAVQPKTPNLLTFQLFRSNERFYVMGIMTQGGGSPPSCSISW